MSIVLTLEMPDELARRAQLVAAATNRRVEDAIVEWIGQAVSALSIQGLPDSDLLDESNCSMEPFDQEELSDLLVRLRENEIDEVGRVRWEELMSSYRAGMVRKARAMKEAVSRGLCLNLRENAG